MRPREKSHAFSNDRLAFQRNALRRPSPLPTAQSGMPRRLERNTPNNRDRSLLQGSFQQRAMPDPKTPATTTLAQETGGLTFALQSRHERNPRREWHHLHDP